MPSKESKATAVHHNARLMNGKNPNGFFLGFFWGFFWENFAPPKNNL